MRILHANALTSPAAVDGINSTIWSVAEEQAIAGHDVGIVLGSPQPDAAEFADRYGVRLHVVGSTLQSYAADLAAAIKAQQIDVIHLHSAFSVRLAVASVVASRRVWRLPGHDSPGGLSLRALDRSRRKKQVYAVVIERQRLGRASLITALHKPEQRHVQRFVPRYRGRFAVVPVPVKHFDVPEREPGIDGPIVFLGRYDLHHKGLDRWLGIARHLPERRFALHGSGPDHAAVRARLSANVTLGEPVYGDEKYHVLSCASMYK